MWLCIFTGLKNLYEGDGEVPPFFAAACELVLGLLPVVGEFENSRSIKFLSLETHSLV